MTEQPIDHDELESALNLCGSSWHASQVHGLLCSRLAVAGAGGAVQWAGQVLEETSVENSLRSECEAMLDRLFAATWQQLAGRQSEFTLLLPDEAESRTLRAEAMGRWCEGFLHGLVSEQHSEVLRQRLAAEPLVDVIKDMLQITRAAATADEEDEDDESAYVELVEYLRIAAQLAFEELADFRSPEGETPATDPQTLH